MKKREEMQVNVAGLRRNIKNIAHNYSDAQVSIIFIIFFDKLKFMFIIIFAIIFNLCILTYILVCKSY